MARAPAVDCGEIPWLAAYRIDIPVYDLMEDAVAKVSARVVTQTFDIPSAGTIVVDLR